MNDIEWIMLGIACAVVLVGTFWQEMELDSTPTFWACCLCDGEWQHPSEIHLKPEEDRCGDLGWVVEVADTPAGRRLLAHYRETYRSDLLK